MNDARLWPRGFASTASCGDAAHALERGGVGSGAGRVQEGARGEESSGAPGEGEERGVWDFSMRRCLAIGGAYPFPVIRATFRGPAPSLTR